MASSSTDEYRIYSSDSGKSPGDHQTVLQKGRLDSLVSTFDFPSTSETKVIVLSTRPGPNQVTPFAANYGWSKWLQNFDSQGQFTVTFGEDLQIIQDFKFRLKPAFSKSWSVEFSSDSTALEDAFGDEANQIAAPGVDKTKEILICALVKPDSKLTATVEDLFFFAGLSGNPLVGGLGVTLDESNYKRNRNAMWFDPSYDLQTTIRLQFGLDNKDMLQRLIDEALTPQSNMQRRFQIEEVHVVCQKVLTEGQTSQGLEGIDNGDVSFSVACALVEGAKRSVTMKGGVKFSSSGITFTLTMTSANALQGVLLWLGEVISDTLQIDSFFGGKGKDGTQSVFGDLNLRQITISLDTGENRSKPSLSSFRIDIEVPAHFGKDANGSQPVFMASYVWSQGMGNLGRINAQLWTPDRNETTKETTLDPDYEEWADLKPITPNPASSLNLTTLIPGHIIEFPNNIKPEISNASVALSQSDFAISATLEVDSTTTSSSGDVPQPPLGVVTLEASYAWQNTSQFKLDLGVLTRLPSGSSTHPDPAVLEGNLSYTWKKVPDSRSS